MSDRVSTKLRIISSVFIREDCGQIPKSHKTWNFMISIIRIGLWWNYTSLCWASRWVSDSLFHTDGLYILQVPNVPQRVTATTTVSNNITESVLMSLTRGGKSVEWQISLPRALHLMKQSIIQYLHKLDTVTYIMRILTTVLAPSHLSKIGAGCDSCLSRRGTDIIHEHLPIPT